MHFNRAQRIVAIVGLCGIVAAGLYPPWEQVCWTEPPLNNSSLGRPVDRTIVYSFLFEPPNIVVERTFQRGAVSLPL